MVFFIKESVLGHDHVTVSVDAVMVVARIFLLIFGIVFQAQVIPSVHVEPNVIIVILLLHVAFFYDNRENVANHAGGDENVRVQVQLGRQLVYLDHVVVSVPNHIAMHQREQSVARYGEGSESSALPEVGDA